ncbi:flagellar filament capping protein FliD [Bacillus andreraoultii]|uniref:flagellar filament capping protein FliD n=1 Tax=Bacillus andreraoultii TaxID=1499685 RepID=UPI00053B1D26|nr:flagellar filament capping protein FliD [Bacillus andreraoultii]
MPLRVTGLASGMNIDEIVENMMKAESIPLNKMKQEKTLLEWKRDSYREVNTLLLDFRTQLTNMKLSSFYRTRSVTSTNENVISATTSSGAAKGTYTISSVSKLATAASKVNMGAISTEGKKVDLTKSLYSQTVGDNATLTNNDRLWKVGTVKTDTILVKDSNEIKLTNLNGANVQKDAFSSFTVEVDGKRYNVISPEDDLTKADVNAVQILEDGTLKFKEPPKANSTIKVSYVADKRTMSSTVSEKTTEISLGEGIYNNSTENPIEVQFNNQTFRQGKDNRLYLIKSDGSIDESQSIGEIDFTSNKIILDKDYQSNFTEATKDSTAENKTATMTISYQQYYTDFSVTTYGADGNAKEEKFLIQASESLNTVISKVNSSKAGVTMFYDSHTDQLTMTRNETGNFNKNGNEIITNGTLLNTVLKFEGATETGGENAEFTINGLITERTSNTFSMNGVSITLKNVTNTPVTINVNNDNDKLFENIKSFVEKYNELVGKIESKLNEPKYKSYKPLTDDEREKLSDKQQEKWEEMAKSGLLKSDQLLSGLITQMRSSVYSSVNQPNIDSTMKTLSAIGISTTGDYTTAKLEINESKLKAAIERDPASIELLFNGTGTTGGEKGIIHRLYDNVNSTMDQLKNRAGNSFSVNHQFTIGRQLNNLDSKIERFEDRLSALETRYYSQFSAMEKAIQKANSQSSYLMSFFS